MIAAAIILFVISSLFMVFGVLFLRGHISLLHDYHYDNVKEEDKKKFSTLLGISFFILSASLLTSGILLLILKEEASYIALIIDLVGLFISVMMMLVVIKKYNGKII